jgi:hypothetical protein
MSNSPVMDLIQSKPAATSQIKERFSENPQLAEGSNGMFFNHLFLRYRYFLFI